jgi:hypothetical protein
MNGEFCLRNHDEMTEDYEVDDRAADSLSMFLLANQGNVVKLDFLICPEAVAYHIDRNNQETVDSIRVGAWPSQGVALLIEQPNRGDVIWNPTETKTMGSLLAYVAVLKVAPASMISSWYRVSVRPLAIEEAVRTPR